MLATALDILDDVVRIAANIALNVAKPSRRMRV